MPPTYSRSAIFSNQTGGTSCLHPAVEGIYIPLRNDYQAPDGPLISPEADFTRYFEGPKYRGAGATKGIDVQDADFIDSILEREGLLSSMSVDRARLAESHEAWIHVVISEDESPDPHLAVFAGFSLYPCGGILTWGNSD